MSFLADPARLPAIVRRLPLGPEMIDEIRGYAVTGDKPGDAIFGAHDESGGGIAVDQLVLRRGQGPPLFRRDREDRPTPPAGGGERLDPKPSYARPTQTEGP